MPIMKNYCGDSRIFLFWSYRNFFVTLHPKIKVDKFGCLQPLQKMLKLHPCHSAMTNPSAKATGDFRNSPLLVFTEDLDF